MFNLKNFIKNLQNKPEPTRIRILWISVAFCMLFVIGIWLLSFENLADKNQANNSIEATEKIFKVEELKKEAEDIPSWDELEEILKKVRFLLLTKEGIKGRFLLAVGSILQNGATL